MAEIPINRRGNQIKDISGQCFGKLRVIEFAALINHKTMWHCVCSCGTKIVASGIRLRRGEITSCGCFKGKWNITHGMYRSPEFKCWLEAKNRCFPRFHHYRNYGGRGITMCEEWRESFEAFYRDMGPRPPGLTLDRIDNNGNYEKSNCRWTTRLEQSRNRRNVIRISHDGLTLTPAEWSPRIGLSSETIRHRYRKGLRPPELFKRPNPGRRLIN